MNLTKSYLRRQVRAPIDPHAERQIDTVIRAPDANAEA